jgi:50S ribosomal subunit-associated GTPase HflX
MSDILLLLVDVRHPFFHFPVRIRFEILSVKSNNEHGSCHCDATFFQVSLYRHVVEDYRKPLVLVMNKIDLVAPELVQRWMDFFRWRYPQLQHVVSFSSHFVLYSEAELKELADYKKIPKRLQKRYTCVELANLAAI